MPETFRLSASLASRFARVALGHVGREYPHKLDHVLAGDGDALPPRTLHPIFHGSFDWHSCVHGYWTLATVLRLHPEIAEAPAIAAAFEAAFTPENVAVEAAYAARPESRGFERPYGWAWLLMLQAELSRHEGQPWASPLAPLAEVFVARFQAFLPLADYPVRAGVHTNTAFALVLTRDYAVQTHDEALLALLRDKALAWYGEDRACQAWEPSGDDFLSSALVEALAMRRLLRADHFEDWFAGFLPKVADRQPATLFAPPRVSDRTDGKIAHLDGLSLSRAWCWRALASGLSPGDPASKIARHAADAHLAVALPHVEGDYMGEHWLASFALLALLET
jgi:hypothetical protein